MGRRIWIMAFVLACVSGLDAMAQVYVPQMPMDVPILVVATMRAGSRLGGLERPA